MRRHLPKLFAALGLALVAFAAPLQAQQVPHPSEVFGFEPGEDYKLADVDQLYAYYRALAEASPRVELKEIGTTHRGRPLLLLFISSEENLAQLERWRSISERLARARIPEEEARQLAREGKAIVWIDAGLHSTEVAHSQHAPLLAHHMATDESEETRRFRDDVVMLLMPLMNPDGHQIVVDWYRRNLGTPFETTRPPEVYHEYVGHDINRDWFMIRQAESKAVSRVIYEEWYPQIIFNHHQTAPFPARIFIPPFADPVNPHIPPLVVRGVNMVGEHMAKRFEEEQMPGVVSRMTFTMWWNGGMRTVPYFKNMIGLLAEVGHASASPAYHDPESLPREFGSGSHRISAREPSVYYANPWPGGWARLGDAVNYHFVASLGTLDIASKLREDWLFNIYRMGRDAIEKGEAGGPFAYVIPPDAQWDRGEAIDLVNRMRLGGVEVHRATADFTAGGQRFPAGSYIIPAGQAFRAYVVDMMEKQEHPHREAYPGGPPERPYGGLAGWTLPMLMGVNSVRIDEPFQARMEPVTGLAPVADGRVEGAANFGYLLSKRENVSSRAVNRLLAQGERVSWTTGAFTSAGREWEPGTFVIESRGRRTAERIAALADELGLDFTGIASRPDVELQRLRQPRVAMYKPWTANMDEGWTRFILDEHDFTLTSLTDRDIRQGDLSRYDVIILADQSAASILNGNAPGTMPDEYVGGLGVEGAAALKRFVERGGRLVTLDGASDFAIQQFGLPVRNAVAHVPGDRLFIPGSLIRLNVDPRHPVAFGMPEEAAAFYQMSRAFQIVRPASAGEQRAPEPRVEVVARYGARDLLLSGWEVGAEQYLRNQPAVVRAELGAGDVVMIGFRSQFRAQPSGTFKFL